MSSISQIRTWLFGNRPFEVQILGGEEAGKTKLLYTLKNNGKPSDKSFLHPASYNRESIHYPLGWEFNIVAVHMGCTPFMLRHGQFHFMTPETLVWLVHDCTSKETIHLRESIQAMREKGPRYLWVIMSKQDLLPPDERDRTVLEHRQAIEAVLRGSAQPAGITWFFVDTPGFNLKSGCFARPFLRGVAETIASLDEERELGHQEAKEGAAPHVPDDDELRARIEASDIKAAGDFWQVFMAAELTSWSHVDHLQAGYMVMLQSIEQGHGLLKCASAFLEHLARLRETRPDVFRNSAHFTMTAFWVIQLRIAAFNFQHDVNSGIAPTGDDFRSVLLGAPTLLHARLWMKHYTQEALFAPGARSGFVMPDVEPFPQAARPLLLRAPAAGRDEAAGAEAQGGDDALAGPERLPRWAFSLARGLLGAAPPAATRGRAVAEALALLEADTIRLRSRGGRPPPPYSETQARFWVRLARSRLAGLSADDAGVDASSLTYERFREVCGVRPEAWQEYYSQDVWESVEARLEFASPDKSALPDQDVADAA